MSSATVAGLFENNNDEGSDDTEKELKSLVVRQVLGQKVKEVLICQHPVANNQVSFLSSLVECHKVLESRVLEKKYPASRI